MIVLIQRALFEVMFLKKIKKKKVLVNLLLVILVVNITKRVNVWKIMVNLLMNYFNKINN